MESPPYRKQSQHFFLLRVTVIFRPQPNSIQRYYIYVAVEPQKNFATPNPVSIGLKFHLFGKKFIIYIIFIIFVLFPFKF